MPRSARVLLSALAAVTAFLYLNNTSLLSQRPAGKPTLLAHRGIAQRFDTRELRSDTCTAARMLPPTHGYLENTVASMRASFAAGADIVEIDVHPTTDGQFAVFHDWTLDCRTEGRGDDREIPEHRTAHDANAGQQAEIGEPLAAPGGCTADVGEQQADCDGNRRTVQPAACQPG